MDIEGLSSRFGTVVSEEEIWQPNTGKQTVVVVSFGDDVYTISTIESALDTHRPETCIFHEEGENRLPYLHSEVIQGLGLEAGMNYLSELYSEGVN